MPKRACGMYLFGGVVPIEPEMLQSSGAFSPKHNCVKIAAAADTGAFCPRAGVFLCKMSRAGDDVRLCGAAEW